MHQSALKTGVPDFYHVSNLSKTVSFTLLDGNIVHPIFRWQLSFPDHDCEGADLRKAPDYKRCDDSPNVLTLAFLLELSCGS